MALQARHAARFARKRIRAQNAHVPRSAPATQRLRQHAPAISTTENW